MFKRIVAILLQLALLITLLALLLGFLGRLHWRLDLFSHFRVQFAGVALIAGLGLFALRRWLMLPIAAFILIVVGWSVAPYYLTPKQNAPANAQRISIISFNVLMENKNTDGVLAYLQAKKPDVIALTEVDLAWTVRLKPLEADYPYRRLVPKGNHAGVSIYSRLPFTGEAVMLTPRGFWSVVGNISVGDRIFKLILTHPVAPTKQDSAQLRDNQVKAVADMVQYSPTPTLLIGDFNASPWSVALQPIAQQTKLHDSALGFGLQQTWPTINPLLRIPIDYIFVPDDFVVINHRIGPNLGSDHYPVEVELAIKELSH